MSSYDLLEEEVVCMASHAVQMCVCMCMDEL